MNLSEIRTQFGELSGRRDLTTVDANGKYGADFFIREGSKLLDGLADVGNSEATAYYSGSPGQFYIVIENLRALYSVWIYTSTGRLQLKELKGKRLKEITAGLLSETEGGLPMYYANASFRVGDLAGAAEPFNALQHVDFGGNESNGILFPKLGETVTFETLGLFYSRVLTADTEDNYWSKYHPMLLVWATLQRLEVSYRNSEGANDWLKAIMLDLRMLEFDHVDQESHNLRQMGGREND